MKTKFKFKKDAVMHAHSMVSCMKRNWDIFCIIADNPNINVTDTMIIMRKDQSTISKKLSELRYFGLVEDLNEGKRESSYAITDKAIEVAESIKSFETVELHEK